VAFGDFVLPAANYLARFRVIRCQLTIYIKRIFPILLGCCQASIDNTIKLMMELNEFLDLCKRRTKSESDSNLARKVEITRAALAAYRKGASFPSDENMLKLAKRAKLDSAECLLLLNIWRSAGEVRKQYKSLLKNSFQSSDFL